MDIPIRWSSNTEELKRNLAQGLNQIEATKAAAEKMVQALQGDKLIQAARNMAAAIQQVGGTTTLTASQMDRANALFEKAGEKLALLGQGASYDAKVFQDLAAQTKGASDATGGWLPILSSLGSSWVARIAEGMLLRDAIREVISAVKNMAEALPELALKGASIADVEENFKRLTAQAGLLSTALLTTLREGTHNTISDFELMKTANNALAAGMNLTDKQFRTLADGAFALAQAKAIDVKTALDTMNDAMLTGRTRALALLTGKIDTAAAEDAFAKKIHGTAAELNEEGKLEAAREAILKAVGAATERLGEQTDGLDERVAQVQTTWANFEDNLGKTIATSATLEAGLSGLKTALQDALGGSQETAIKSIGDAVDDLLIRFVELARTGVSVGGDLVTEYYAVKKVFGDLAQIVQGDALAFEYLALGVAKLGQSATVGDASKKYGEDVKRINENIDSLLISISKRGAALQEDDKAQSKVNETTAKYDAILVGLKARMQDAKAGQDAFVGPLQDGASALDASTKAGTAHAGMLKEDGKSAEEAAKAQAKVAEAWARLNELTTDYRETLATLSDDQVAEIARLLKLGASVEDITTAYGDLSKSQVEAVKSGLAHEAMVVDATRAVELLSNKIDERLKVSIGNWIALQRSLNGEMAPLEAFTIELSDGVSDLSDRLVPLQQGFDGARKAGHQLSDQFKEAASQFDLLGKSLGGFASDLQILAQVSGPSFGGVIKDIAELVAAWNMAAQAAANYQKASGHIDENTGEWVDPNRSGQALSLFQGGTAVVSATDPNQHSTAGAIAGGAVTGAEVGTMIMPGIGTAVGAGVGALIGWLRSLDSVKSGLQEIGYRWGATMSDAMTKKIEDDTENLFNGNEVAAMTANMKDLIAASGGLTSSNLEGWAGHLRDTFSLLQTGIIDTSQATQILDQNFSDFAAAGTDQMGVLNSKVVELIKLDQQYGTESKQIAAYVGQQGQTAAQQLGTALGVSAAAYTKWKADSQQYMDLQWKVAGTSGAAADALKQQIDDLATDMAAQYQIYQATTVKTQDQATAMGAAIVGAFDAEIQGGKSFQEALNDIAPAVQNLQALIGGTGMTGGAAFDKLADQIKITKDAVAGPALTALQAYTSAMVALGNTGSLTRDEFKGFGQQVGQTFKTLVEGGQDGATVMIAMQAPLQKLWEEEQQYGYKLDDATQALLDQAVAAGEVGETHKSTTDQMLDAENKLVDIMGLLATAMGVTLPQSIQDGIDKAITGPNGVNALQTSLNNVRAPDVEIPVRWDVPPMPTEQGPGGDNGYGTPGFAGGVRNFRGGWAWVGEDGPELMKLPTGSDIVPQGLIPDRLAPPSTIAPSLRFADSMAQTLMAAAAVTGAGGADLTATIALLESIDATLKQGRTTSVQIDRREVVRATQAALDNNEGGARTRFREVLGIA